MTVDVDVDELGVELDHSVIDELRFRARVEAVHERHTARRPAPLASIRRLPSPCRHWTFEATCTECGGLLRPIGRCVPLRLREAHQPVRCTACLAELVIAITLSVVTLPSVDVDPARAAAAEAAYSPRGWLGDR